MISSSEQNLKISIEVTDLLSCVYFKILIKCLFILFKIFQRLFSLKVFEPQCRYPDTYRLFFISAITSRVLKYLSDRGPCSSHKHMQYEQCTNHLNQLLTFFSAQTRFSPITPPSSYWIYSYLLKLLDGLKKYFLISTLSD